MRVIVMRIKPLSFVRISLQIDEAKRWFGHFPNDLRLMISSRRDSPKFNRFTRQL
jgi:hypothetical protein